MAVCHGQQWFLSVSDELLMGLFNEVLDGAEGDTISRDRATPRSTRRLAMAVMTQPMARIDRNGTGGFSDPRVVRLSVENYPSFNEPQQLQSGYQGKRDENEQHSR